MSLRIYNTASKNIEDLAPREPQRVRFYSCGPTAYGFTHIGNLRAFVTADLFARAARISGHAVDWVMNITDVDDKTIANTIREFGTQANTDRLREYTDRYAQAFYADLRKVGVDSSHIQFVNVSDVIPEIQKFIVRLIELGYAYKADDGSTYFSIERYQEKFGSYGALVGEKFLEGKQAGARVAVDEYDKENLSDFALWKTQAENDGEIFWDHEILGRGRPGWHIECTLINYMKFPEGTDVHCGGVDLIFPHHTNEIAQAEPVYHPFVRQWLHSEHIMVDGKKMSKSLGNFYTLDDLEQQSLGDGPALRFLILQSHYRAKLNITKESLKAATAGLRNLRSQIKSLAEAAGGVSVDRYSEPNEYVMRLRQAMENDLDTPVAMALISEVLKSPLPAMEKLETLRHFENALGLELIAGDGGEPAAIPAAIKDLITLREKARAEKDFAQSDILRQEIEDLGYDISDTADGPTVTIRK